MPEREQDQPGGPEGKPPSSGRGLADGHRGCLIDHEVRGPQPGKSAWMENLREGHAVEGVADSKEQTRGHRGEGRSARCRHSDERELGSSGEHDQAQRHRSGPASIPTQQRSRRRRRRKPSRKGRCRLRPSGSCRAPAAALPWTSLSRAGAPTDGMLIRGADRLMIIEAGA